MVGRAGRCTSKQKGYSVVRSSVNKQALPFIREACQDEALRGMVPNSALGKYGDGLIYGDWRSILKEKLAPDATL